jgi:outer membrane protein OmpA-like peptidoglycan-associated protein
MFLLRESLSLSRTWTDEDEVVVISWFEWQRVHAESGYHEIDSHKAIWMLDSLDCHHLMEARHFVSNLRLNSFPLSQMDDDEVLELIRQALNNRRLVAIQKGAEQPAIPSVTVQLRRLVAQVEKATRDKLSYQGRQYKLVVDVELASTPGRDYYEVASQSEARAALDSMAKISPASADLIKQASDKLTKDWSPPSQPDGLILLRRIPTQASTPKDTGPTITPSQMKALLEKERPVTFFARFVDEHGKGLSGFKGNLAHGSDPNSDMTFPDSGFAKVPLKGEKQAWLTLPDDATKDLVLALKKRWQEIRGTIDEAWKAKEESLVEALFQKGKLPELQLEAEKKHTFMLRPPVALARMHGMYFDTNKCFLLPTAMGSMQRLVDLYDENLHSDLLLVGHTDTSGKDAYNETLSLERAKSMAALLTNDVSSWLDYYGEGIAEEKRWGDLEDGDMLQALAERWHLDPGRSAVESYQTWHNQLDGGDKAANWEALKVDGEIGPKTRTQLVGDYMNCQGTTLPDDVSLMVHGCGEYFPLNTEGDDLDANPQDGQHDQDDRRVELFFFDKAFGILPPPPDEISKRGSEEYPEWRRCARILKLLPVGETTILEVRLLDPDGKPYHDLHFKAYAGDVLLASRMIPEDGVIELRVPVDAENATLSLYLPDDDSSEPSDDDSRDHIDWTFAIQDKTLTESTRDKGQRLLNLGFANDLPPGDEVTDDMRLAMADYQSSTDEAVDPGQDDSTLLAQLVSDHDATDSSSEPAADGSSDASTGVA